MAAMTSALRVLLYERLVFRVPVRGFRKAYIGKKEDEDGGDLLTTHIGEMVIACL